MDVGTGTLSGVEGVLFCEAVGRTELVVSVGWIFSVFARRSDMFLTATVHLLLGPLLPNL